MKNSDYPRVIECSLNMFIDELGEHLTESVCDTILEMVKNEWHNPVMFEKIFLLNIKHLFLNDMDIGLVNETKKHRAHYGGQLFNFKVRINVENDKHFNFLKLKFPKIIKEYYDD